MASSKLTAMRILDQTVTDKEVNDLSYLRARFMDIQGVMQHHDAVTGTEKTHVLENYKYVLYRQI